MGDARQLQLGEVIFPSSAGFTSSGPGRVEDLNENGEEPPDGELPGGGNMSQSSPWWSRPDTFPRKNATIPRYGFSSPGKTVTPIAFSGNTLQVDISNLWIVIFQALMSVGVIAQQSF